MEKLYFDIQVIKENFWLIEMELFGSIAIAKRTALNRIILSYIYQWNSAHCNYKFFQDTVRAHRKFGEVFDVSLLILYASSEELSTVILTRCRYRPENSHFSSQSQNHIMSTALKMLPVREAYSQNTFVMQFSPDNNNNYKQLITQQGLKK